MSLLLDALKKAAQEKQNADSVDSASAAPENAGAEADLSLVRDAELTLADIEHAGDGEGMEPELVLEDTEVEDTEVDEPLSLQAGDDETAPRYQPAPFMPTNGDERSFTPTPSTISDDALQLLINKTNVAHRKARIVSWGGVILGSLVLLSISGLYFYSNMMNEIDSIHRKHQIALATLKSKTRIEENLTSLAIVPDAEKNDKGLVEAESRANEAVSRNAGDQSPGDRPVAAGQAITLQRTDKRDPVSEALERGWALYQQKEYGASLREYEKAAKAEPDNHDALLGIAAVSSQQDDLDTARDIYIRLLEKDPRDPLAHAGLANIAQTEGASLSESRLKQLIEYRPDDSHLQFALGNLYVQKKSWPEAQQAFFNAWKGDSENPDYAYNLAVSLDQMGKHEEARTFYEDSLKLAAGKNINFSAAAVRTRLAHLDAVK